MKLGTRATVGLAGAFALIFVLAVGNGIRRAEARVAAASCTPAPIGLVSWWPADGNSLDVRGQNNGTPTGGATFGTGKVGQAFNFDGTGFVTAASPSSLPTSQFTIEAWVNPTSVTGLHTITDARSASGYTLRINNGKAQLTLSTLANGTITVTGPTSIPTGSSTHIAGSYDGSNIRLYVNGV